MTFYAKEIMARAATTLLDKNSIRWSALDLLEYLNNGVQQICTDKPNANSLTVTLQLQSGTYQELDEEYTILSRVTRNLTLGHDDPGGPTGAGAILPVDGHELMDSMFPGWQDGTLIPFAAKVVHVFYDMTNPRSFYVCPGNNGTGKIEAIVGRRPEKVLPPSAPDNLVIANYDYPVPLPDAYRNALYYYVLGQAYTKDIGIAGAGQKAEGYMTLYSTTMQALLGAETAMNLTAEVGGAA